MGILFRAAQKNDLAAFYALALESGVGLTTLPKNKSVLENRLENALQSFLKEVIAPEDEYYLFVLEDVGKKQVVGTAAIEASTGFKSPFYSYRRTKEIKAHPPFGISVMHDYLSLTYDNENKSEVCTLYLDPRYRHNGNGLLLSLARFLFMYHFPKRFKEQVIAELRGVSLAGQSPFWNAVGQRFFDMPFSDADERTITTDKHFIANLVPRHPIYVNLLPETAQKVIGIPDMASQPAMNMLIQQGFKFNETVDIFDAGPTLEAKKDEIRTIQNAQQLRLQITSVHQLPTQRTLMSNNALAFRAILDHAYVDPVNQTCIVSQAIAHRLELEEGDLITISKI